MYLNYKSHMYTQKFYKIPKENFFFFGTYSLGQAQLCPLTSLLTPTSGPLPWIPNLFHHGPSAEINNRVAVVEYRMRNPIHPIRNWILSKRLLKHSHHIFRNCY